MKGQKKISILKLKKKKKLYNILLELVWEYFVDSKIFETFLKLKVRQIPTLLKCTRSSFFFFFLNPFIPWKFGVASCFYNSLTAHNFSENPNSRCTSWRCVPLVTKVTRVTDNPSYHPRFSPSRECLWLLILALRCTPSHDIVINFTQLK